jgi:hypothetical protein
LIIDSATGNIVMGITPDAAGGYKVKAVGNMMLNATNPGFQLYDNITWNSGMISQMQIFVMMI